MPNGEPEDPDTEMFYDFDPVNESGQHEHDIHKNSKWSKDIVIILICNCNALWKLVLPFLCNIKNL